ncbi:MAG: flippase-like domain-containing protein [Thermoplasmata archaeon]
MNQSWNTKMIIISVIISLVVIAIIISGTITKETFLYLFTLDPFLFLIAIGLHLIYWFAWAGRIKILSKSMNYSIGYLKSLNIVMVNVLAASVTPSNAGGEPVRIKMLNDLGVRGGDATAIVISERVSDAIFFLAIFPLLIIFFGLSISGIIGTLLIFAIILLASLIIIISILVWKHKNVEKFLEKFDSILKFFVKGKEKRFKLIEKLKMEFRYFQKGIKIMILKRKLNFIVVMILTAIIWISDFIIFSIILLSLHQDPLWIYSIFAQILIVLLSTIPISPGGSGLVEFVAAILYAPFIRKDVIGVVILIWRFIVFYLNIIVGLFFTLRHVVKR